MYIDGYLGISSIEHGKVDVRRGMGGGKGMSGYDMKVYPPLFCFFWGGFGFWVLGFWVLICLPKKTRIRKEKKRTRKNSKIDANIQVITR